MLFNPIYNKKRRTTPKYFLVRFPGDWVALRSLWKYQPWALMDTVNPSYNQVLIWDVLAPDEWHLLALRMPLLWPSWATLLFSPLCHKLAKSTANTECWETAWDSTVPKINFSHHCGRNTKKSPHLMATGSFLHCPLGLNPHHQKRNNKIPSLQLKPSCAFSPGL